MPEGDSLHAAARRLSVLVGEPVSAASPNPRAAVLGIAPRLDGKRLERVEAVGKNLLLTFEGGLVLRSHLRMKGRWRVLPADAAVTGSPWLVLEGASQKAVLWHGPVLELGRGAPPGLGPDIMADPPDVDRMLERARGSGGSRAIGELLLDQRIVAGIGNMWKAEGLFAARLSPWLELRAVADEDLVRLFELASRLMRAGSRDRLVYRRAGRPCSSCGTAISSRPQGDGARMAYWCPGCQPSR